MDRIVGLDRIRAARDRLGGRVHRTPMLSSTTAAELARSASGIQLADGRLYVKAEHLQKTGSFKARATVSRLAALTPAGHTEPR